MYPGTTSTFTTPLSGLVPLAKKLRRRSLVLGLVVIAVLLWAAMATVSHPAPLMHLTQVSWPRYDAGGLHVAYPPGWSVTPLADEAGYRLAPVGASAGSHITFNYLPEAPTRLAPVERLGVIRLERDASVTRHYVRILPRTRMSGRPAARLRYTAYLAAGPRIEGVWIAMPLPDGRLLAATLTVHPGTHFKSAHAIYDQVLRSLVLANTTPLG